MVWAVQGDVHEVQWPWHYSTPETQTHQSPPCQLLKLTVIFGPYLAWPSLCINDARDSVPSGLFLLPLLQWHFLSGETAWDSGFWQQPRRGLHPVQILCGTAGVWICRAAVRRRHRVSCAPWTCSCGAIPVWECEWGIKWAKICVCLEWWALGTKRRATTELPVVPSVPSVWEYADFFIWDAWTAKCRNLWDCAS